MKLIENYIVCDDGNIFYNGKLLFADECCNLAQYTANSELLEILSQNENWGIRFYVAGNRSTPPNILKILSQDENINVRRWVAWNKSTPIEILKKLSQDEDCSVRYYVARNPSTPTNILKKLSQDEDYHVQYYAKQALKKKKP